MQCERILVWIGLKKSAEERNDPRRSAFIGRTGLIDIEVKNLLSSITRIRR